MKDDVQWYLRASYLWFVYLHNIFSLYIFNGFWPFSGTILLRGQINVFSLYLTIWSFLPFCIAMNNILMQHSFYRISIKFIWNYAPLYRTMKGYATNNHSVFCIFGFVLIRCCVKGKVLVLHLALTVTYSYNCTLSVRCPINIFALTFFLISSSHNSIAIQK